LFEEEKLNTSTPSPSSKAASQLSGLRLSGSQDQDSSDAPYDLIHGDTRLASASSSPTKKHKKKPKGPVQSLPAICTTQPRSNVFAPQGPLGAVDLSRPSNSVLENPVIKDRLGTLVAKLSQDLQSCATWEEFVQHVRGRSYLADTIDDIDHPAKSLLQHYRNRGVPVKVRSDKWTPAKIQECLNRGAHPSAILHKEFLRDEMADFCESGFWVVLPYELVKDLENLKLSPPP
jgi:hypothetical protein